MSTTHHLLYVHSEQHISDNYGQATHLMYFWPDHLLGICMCDNILRSLQGCHGTCSQGLPGCNVRDPQQTLSTGLSRRAGKSKKHNGLLILNNACGNASKSKKHNELLILKNACGNASKSKKHNGLLILKNACGNASKSHKHNGLLILKNACGNASQD